MYVGTTWSKIIIIHISLMNYLNMCNQVVTLRVREMPFFWSYLEYVIII